MREGLECWFKHPGLDSHHVLTLDLPSEYSVTSPGSVTAETFFGRVCLHSAQDFPVLTNPPQVLSFLKSEYSDCQRSRIFSVSLIAPEKWVSGTVAGPFIAPSHTVPLLLSWYWDSEVSSKVTHLQISEGPTSAWSRRPQRLHSSRGASWNSTVARVWDLEWLIHFDLDLFIWLEWLMAG